MKDIIIKSTLSNIDYIINFLNIDKNIFSDLKSKIPILSNYDNEFLNNVCEKLDKIILDKAYISLNETNIKDFRLKSIFTLFRNNNINEEYYYPLNINNAIIYPKLKSELGESNIDLEKLKSDLNDIDINNINSFIKYN